MNFPHQVLQPTRAILMASHLGFLVMEEFHFQQSVRTTVLVEGLRLSQHDTFTTLHQHLLEKLL